MLSPTAEAQKTQEVVSRLGYSFFLPEVTRIILRICMLKIQQNRSREMMGNRASWRRKGGVASLAKLL